MISHHLFFLLNAKARTTALTAALTKGGTGLSTDFALSGCRRTTGWTFRGTFCGTLRGSFCRTLRGSLRRTLRGKPCRTTSRCAGNVQTTTCRCDDRGCGRSCSGTGTTQTASNVNPTTTGIDTITIIVTSICPTCLDDSLILDKSRTVGCILFKRTNLRWAT